MNLTPFEESILTGIVGLAEYLPHPLEKYTKYLARIRLQKYGTAGQRGKGECVGGFVEQHEVRARDRWT